MTDIENEPPRGHIKMVYMGPVAPHWEMRSDFGDKDLIDGLRTRVEARLVLLPPHDPQFRRNRERVNRDAERENILIEWGPLVFLFLFWFAIWLVCYPTHSLLLAI